MMLQFLCPNGHKIHCPEDRAGKAAKCPKCGVKFQVPDISDLEAAGSGDSLPVVSDSSSAIPASGDATARDLMVGNSIEFLCPNGHRLHGSANMQGRLGQCPDCGTKFHVPSYDVEDENQQPKQQAQGPGSKKMAEWEVEKAGAHATRRATPRETFPSVVPVEVSRFSSHVSPIELFAKLWAEKSSGSDLELHLGDGTTIMPDCFSEKLSQENYGVFAVHDTHGTHTLMAVAWRAIVKVIVRGVQQLPDDMEGANDHPLPPGKRASV